MERILGNKIPETLRMNNDLDLLTIQLKEEITIDYIFSARKAIGECLVVLTVVIHFSLKPASH